MEYGKKIAQLRKSQNMTQEELGKVLSVTYQAVSKWERDESLPDFEMMARIAKYFNVPLSYFTDDEETAATAEAVQPAPAVTAEKVGMCTQCGKMLEQSEVAQMEPKILCKSCAERLKEQAEKTRAAIEARDRERKDKAIYEQRGYGVNVSLIISSVLALVLYIVLTIYCQKVDADSRSGAGAFLFFVPLAVFGAIQAFCSFIKEMRDILDDGPEGYNRTVSLITAGAFAVVNLACFLALYISSKDTVYLIFLALSVILSFTFVSQFMWGGVVRTVFTAGGFTFKLPGFIFTLTVDSILWMIITKFLLGLLAAVIFVVTTVLVTLVAVFISAFTFFPSLLTKSVKDKQVEKENQ